MDNNNPQLEEDTVTQPTHLAESAISSQPSQPHTSPIKATFPTFINAGSKLKTHILRPKRVIKLLAVVVFGATLFFVGYNLAVYQEQNNLTLLPHFSFGNHCSTYGSGTNDLLRANSCDNTYCTNGLCGGNQCPNGGGCSIADEPVIYLYPTQAENINVKVSYLTGLSKTEPQYNTQTGWQVLAQPDGTLTNSADTKTYPYLIWEGNPAPLNFDMSSGFVVSGSETSSFLQHQLAVMGLNQNEITTFKAYWLPRMEQNPYNLIHFAGSDYTRLAPLHISPEPNSLLRVFMVFKPLKTPVSVSPQTFPTFNRTGFTAVEWGGTQLNGN
jgi:hypothetical protein